MDRIVIDEKLHEKVLNLTSPAELVTHEGYVVGVVQPRFDPALYEVVGPEASDEELDRRSKSDGPWHTTDEVLARLRKLA
jgi:hypothetical protein